MLLKRNTRVAF